MSSILFVSIITGLVITISILIEFFFSIFQIFFKKPLSPKGAVQIDATEHIYAHPDYAIKLEDHRAFGAKTTYEALLHGLKLSGDQPSISFRNSSDQPFQSYSHK